MAADNRSLTDDGQRNVTNKVRVALMITGANGRSVLHQDGKMQAEIVALMSVAVRGDLQTGAGATHLAIVAVVKTTLVAVSQVAVPGLADPNDKETKHAAKRTPTKRTETAAAVTIVAEAVEH